MDRERIAEGVPPRLRPVEQPMLDAIAAAMADGATPVRAAAGLLERRRADLDRQAALFEDYSEKVRSAVTADQERGQILAFAEALGAGPLRRLGDRLAMRRWHGWDAMVDRHTAAVGRIEREIAFLLDRLGVFAARTLTESRADEARQTWRSLGIDAITQPFLDHPGDRRVRIAAFAALARAASALPPRHAVGMLSPLSLQLIYAAAFDPSRHIWTQVAALDVLRVIARDDFIGSIRVK